MPRTVGNVPRIMVNAPSAAPAQPAAAAPAVHQRTKSFTAEQFHEAWQGYIDQHPQERALVTTMSYASPEQADTDGHYVMIVGSPAEQKAVEERRETIMRFLCDALENDHLTLDVKVSETPIETPKILSPREVVDELKQRNPGFTQFLKDFDLGLA